MSINKKVYIVLVNYKGWQDTIECLESVLKNDYDNFQVIVVDNDSQNDSIYKIQKWSEGKIEVEYSGEERLRHLVFPNVTKPISFVNYNKSEALKASNAKDLSLNNPLVLIDAGENNGFAGGNNIGIKYAQLKADFEYIWLLNNDTIIEKNALSILVEGISKHNDVAAVGSKLLYYDEPELIQSLGSKIDNKSIYKLNKPIINTSKKNLEKNNFPNEIEVNDIMGASLMIKKDVIEKFGLIPEDYFLYGEETDWNFSFQKNGYKLLTIPASIVYHKENRSTGGAGNPTMLYYKTRNQFLLNNRYRNIFFFNMKLYFFQYLIRKFLTAIFSHAQVRKAILKGLMDGLNGKFGK